MTLTPAITVVLPFYNREKFLDQAITSIKNQTIKNFELLLIDDGSTDQSRMIAKRHTNKRCKLLCLPTRTGVSTARNIGISYARTPYIAIMDSDDASMPKRLESQLQALESDMKKVVVGTQCIQHNENTSVQQHHPIEDADIKANLFLSNGSAMINSSTLIRANFLRKHSLHFPNTHRGEDHELWLQIMLHGGEFLNLNTTLHRYYRHDKNLTKDRNLFSYNLRRRFFFKKNFLVNVFPSLTGNEASALAFETTYSEHDEEIRALSDQAIKKIRCTRPPGYGVSRKRLITLIEIHRNEF
jgi:glycosyltransferase involved in cell wall biosynthesis